MRNAERVAPMDADEREWAVLENGRPELHPCKPGKRHNFAGFVVTNNGYRGGGTVAHSYTCEHCGERAGSPDTMHTACQQPAIRRKGDYRIPQLTAKAIRDYILPGDPKPEARWARQYVAPRMATFGIAPATKAITKAERATFAGRPIIYNGSFAPMFADNMETNGRQVWPSLTPTQ